MVAMTVNSNLVFVFTEASLQDALNMYFTCQGMANAYLLRYRFNQRDDPDVEDARIQLLSKIPFNYSLPFSSCYKNSMYHDCFARRVWNKLLLVKL